MIGSVAAGLLATGIVSGGQKSKQYVSDKIREQQYSTEIGPILTEFNSVFEEKIRNHDDREVRSVALLWDDIGSELQEVNAVFESEEDAVENIVGVIAEYEEDLSESLKNKLEDVVLELYREAVAEFKRVISEEGNIAEALSAELSMEILQSVQNLEGRLKRLTGVPQRYTLEDSDNVNAFIEDALPVSTETEFVNRSELDDVPEAKRILLAGPAGSGKTRLLRRLVHEYADNVTHLLNPDSTLTYPQSEYAIERQQFDGDVLLVWDDIHRINTEQDNEVFEAYIKAIAKRVTNQDQNLHVLASARSGNLVDLPGKGIKSVEDIKNSNKGFWGKFQPVEITDLTEEQLEILTARMAESHGVELKPRAKEALVTKASHTSAPNYIDSVFDTLDEGEEATREHIDSLAETAAGIWERQYAKLVGPDNDEELMEVLRSCRVLYDLNIAYHAPLVWGIYRHVLGGGEKGKSTFLSAVERLKNRKWLRTSNPDKTYEAGLKYHLHDTQLESVNHSLADYTNEFSMFLLQEVEKYLPNETDDLGPELNVIFANWIDDTGNSNMAEIHYRRALRETSPTTDPLNSNYGNFHYSYAYFLENDGRTEAAKTHYRRVIDETSPSEGTPRPQARMNLGKLLADEGKVEDGKTQYELILEETTASDDLYDAPRIKAHVNYALQLKKEDQRKDAEIHYRRALDESSQDKKSHQLPRIKAHLNYANLLLGMGRKEDAEKHYRRSLKASSPTDNLIDAWFERAHYDYANFLQNENQKEEAEEHYRRGLKVDSPTDEPIDAKTHYAHYGYASLLNNDGRAKDAKKHYRRGLEIDGPTNDPIDAESPHSHYMYALLMQKEGEVEIAENHYRRVIEVTSPTDGSPRPQARMNLARLLKEEGQMEGAKTQYQQIIEETSPTDDLFDDPRQKACVNYAIIKREEGQIDDAKMLCNRVVEETSPGEDLHGSPRIKALGVSATLLREEGETGRAKTKYHQALKESSPTSDPINSNIAGLHEEYASFLEEKGQAKQAEKHRQRVHKLKEKNRS